MKTYDHVVDDLEELDDIRTFDEATASEDEAIPF